MKMNLSSLMKTTQRFIVRRSPEILTGLGIVGMIGAGISAVKATPKALILMDEARNEKNDELTSLEVVKTTWKCYTPAVVATIVSSGCIIGASSVNFRRNAALATAYSLSETALREYQEKVVEKLGKEKDDEIRSDIAKDRIRRNPWQNNEVFITESGNTLCYDTTSGRYFRADIDKLNKVQNELNRRMLDEMYISLNDLYYEWGIASTSSGDDLGWNIDNGFIDMCFSAILDENDCPCLAIDYRVAPKQNYYKS